MVFGFARVGSRGLCLGALLLSPRIVLAQHVADAPLGARGVIPRSSLPRRTRAARATTLRSRGGVVSSRASGGTLVVTAQRPKVMAQNGVDYRPLSLQAGGRQGSLDLVATATADDASFFEANAAGSATIPRMTLAFFHTMRISDSHIDVLSFVGRAGRTGYGVSARAFYPDMSSKTTGFVGIFNVSHAFSSAYRFKGVSVGANLKVGYRHTRGGNGKAQKSASGKENHHIVLTADVGVRGAWTVSKNFGAHEPNLWAGVAFRNIGASINATNLHGNNGAGGSGGGGGGNGDGKPAHVTDSRVILALAYQPVRYFLFGAGLEWLYNVESIKAVNSLRYGAAFMLFPLRQLAFSSSVVMKGMGPQQVRASAGVEVQFSHVRCTASYSYLWSETPTRPHYVSIGVAGFLKPVPEQPLWQEVYRSYLRGLRHYHAQRYAEAIAEWKRTLQQGVSFEPAREGIERATKLLQLNQKVHDFNIF